MQSEQHENIEQPQDQKIIDKSIEDYLKNVFSRPFSRKLQYVYTGIAVQENAPLIFSNTLDTEFKYCEPNQATGLIFINKREDRDRVVNWFNDLNIDISKPGIILLNLLMSTLNHIKWDTSLLDCSTDKRGVVTIVNVAKLSVDEDGKNIEVRLPIFRPIDSHFVVMKLSYVATKYTEVFANSENIEYTDIPLSMVDEIESLLVNGSTINEAKLLGDSESRDFRLLLIRGLDLITPKSLIIEDNTAGTFGMRIWRDGPSCLNYGSFFRSSDGDLLLCSVRDNIFVFPKQT